MAIPLQVIGERYGRLTIVEETVVLTKYKRRFKCLCDCGKYTIVQLSNLRSSHTQSCGCLNFETMAANRLTHGMSGTSEYKSYRKMIERCYYVKDIGYHNYGGSGIIVCDEWKNSFENFINDMGYKPSKNHSLDRIKTSGNYEPSNCRWATRKKQNNNKKNNVRLEYDGLILPISEWAEKLNIPRYTLYYHYSKGVSFIRIVEYINANGTKRLQFNKTGGDGK